MRSLGLCLILPLAWSTACSDDTQPTGGGGHGGASSGGASSGGTDAGGGDAGGGGAGQGGRGDGGAVPDGVVIAFPPPRSITDEDTIIVRGTASVEGTVESITVAGIDATSSDGFTNWQVAVPLNVGAHTLTVEAVVDGATSIDLDSVEIDRRGALIENPTLFAFDPAGDRAFVAGPVSGGATAIYAIDLGTNAQSHVSNDTLGAGPVLDEEIFTIDWDPTGERILVFTWFDLWAIDPDTGDRTILFDRPAGNGPWPGEDNEAVVDVENDRIIVTADSLNDWVAAIDLSSFQITRLAASDNNGPAVGSGPELGDQMGLVHDVANNRLLVGSDEFDTYLYAIDLSTLERTVVSSLSTGSGQAALGPRHLALDGGTVWASSRYNSDVTAIDLATGARTKILGMGTGSGPIVLSLTAIGHDGDRLLGTDFALDALLEIDGVTGARSIVSGYSTGDGDALRAPNALAWDEASGRVLAVDAQLNGLASIDTTTGDRDVLSSWLFSIGEGDPVSLATDLIAVDGAALLTAGTALKRIDLATGDRTVLSGMDVGSGPAFTDLAGVAIRDSQPSDIWVIDRNAGVLHVDPVTGDRTTVSDQSTGEGPVFEYPQDLIFDEAQDRLIAITAFGVFSVDLSSGDRVELSGVNVGTGSLRPGKGILEGDVLYVGAGVTWTRVDLSTGDRVVLSDYDDPGPGLVMVGDTADAEHGWFLSSEINLGAIIATDRVTGERVLLSK